MKVSSFIKDVALISKRWKMLGTVNVMGTIVTILLAEL